MRRFLVGLAAAILIAGCSGDETAAFGEGREWAPVFTISPVAYDDDRAAAEAQMPAVLDAFDYPFDRSEMEPFFDGRSVLLRGPNNSMISYGLQNVREWSYGNSGENRDRSCRECEPVEFTEDEAVAWALDRWRSLGLDPEVDLEVQAPYAYTYGDTRGRSIEVSALQKFNGVPSSLEWTIVFGGPDGVVRSARGYWGLEVVERGEVPLLTPEEAFGTRPVDGLLDEGSVSRGGRVFLDRSNGVFWLVPSYFVDLPVGEASAPVHLDAIRYEDLPEVDEVPVG